MLVGWGGDPSSSSRRLWLRVASLRAGEALAGQFMGACFSWLGGAARDDLWDAIFDLAGCDGGGLCAFFFLGDDLLLCYG